MTTPTDRIKALLNEGDRVAAHLSNMVEDLKATLAVQPELLVATVAHWTSMPLPGREATAAEKVRLELTWADNQRRKRNKAKEQ